MLLEVLHKLIYKEAFHKWSSAVQIIRACVPTTVILVWCYESWSDLFFPVLKQYLFFSIILLSCREVKKTLLSFTAKETCVEWEIRCISSKNPYRIKINHGSLSQLLTLERMGKESLEQYSVSFIYERRKERLWHLIFNLLVIYTNSKVLFQKKTSIFSWPWPDVS